MNEHLFLHMFLFFIENYHTVINWTCHLCRAYIMLLNMWIVHTNIYLETIFLVI